MIPVGLIFTSELIGKEVLGETSKSIYHSISNISSFNEIFLNQVIEELDLLKKIEIVNSLYDNNWRSLISYTPQEIELVSGTIKDNIIYSEKEFVKMRKKL